MGWAYIFEFYPERKRGVKSKNIKAQPRIKVKSVQYEKVGIEAKIVYRMEEYG
jgi:hypothetical protein